ncbi:hypothetical protein [Nocardia sp. NPDC057030]|uniref:hypothetical protein n=1 Tax=unclassified Nocardia TaxID=2637762 RepID=UPI0036414B1A
MSIHRDPAPMAGAVVRADIGRGPESLRIEDWWDRVSGGSWMFADGNPAALKYAIRSGLAGLPIDNDVVYGKDDSGFGQLIHVSEVLP